MNDELPDEWFRAGRGDDDVDATRIRPFGALRSAAGQVPDQPFRTQASGMAAATPVPVPASEDRVGVAAPGGAATVDDDERFTDQFKPGYIPRVEVTDPGRRTSEPAGAHTATASPAGGQAGEPAGSFGENSAGATYSLGEVQAAPQPRRPRLGARRVRRGVQAGLLLGVVLALGLGGGTWLASRQGRQSTPAGTVTPHSGSSPQVPYSGSLSLVSGVKASAECVAPAATATDGSRITYLPSNLVDGRATTAWRCPGSAIGQKIVFTLPAHTSLVGMGIVNGYTKTAPDGTDYYKRYRRVDQVTWNINGLTASQDLSDIENEQRITIPPQQVDAPVTLTIVRVSDPGAGDAASNATLISTVSFYTKG